jgi:hypothetical protein
VSARRAVLSYEADGDAAASGAPAPMREGSTVAVGIAPIGGDRRIQARKSAQTNDGSPRPNALFHNRKTVRRGRLYQSMAAGALTFRPSASSVTAGPAAARNAVESCSAASTCGTWWT